MRTAQLCAVVHDAGFGAKSAADPQTYLPKCYRAKEAPMQMSGKEAVLAVAQVLNLKKV